MLRDLKHPYIVRYKESFLEDGWLCIVQEYCEGELFLVCSYRIGV